MCIWCYMMKSFRWFPLHRNYVLMSHHVQPRPNTRFEIVIISIGKLSVVPTIANTYLPCTILVWRISMPKLWHLHSWKASCCSPFSRMLFSFTPNLSPLSGSLLPKFTDGLMPHLLSTNSIFRLQSMSSSTALLCAVKFLSNSLPTTIRAV